VDGSCVRDALFELFEWPVDGSNWLAFIDGPEAADLERLASLLGLEGFDPDVEAERLSPHLDHPGISVWALHQVRMSHALFEPHVRFPRPLPPQHHSYNPERFRVFVDLAKPPRFRGSVGH
jgi:hypothetical protein